MPSRTRKVSENDSLESSSLLGFPHSRVSPTVYMQDGNTSGETPITQPSVKRQRRSGLDSRLDRMLQRVNTTYSARSPASQVRKRALSASSSSSMSYEPPKTPVDVYHAAVEQNSLGEGFSVIKLNGSSSSRGACSDRPHDTDLNKRYPERLSKPLPTWLSETFSTLEHHHPLRLLVQPPEIHRQPVKNPSEITFCNPETKEATNSKASGDDDDVFAFMPPATALGTTETHTNDSSLLHDLAYESVVPFTYQNTHDPSPLIHETVPFDDSLTVFSSSTPEPTQLCGETGSIIIQRNPTDLRNEPDYVNRGLPTLVSQNNLSLINETHVGDIPFNPFSTPGPASALNFEPSVSNTLYANALDANAHDFPPSINAHVLDAFDFVMSPTPTQQVPSMNYHDSIIPLNDTDSINVTEIPLSAERLFRTPGPTFCAPPPVYFSSPNEDPADSDPAELAFDDLDFHWSPFPRNDSGRSRENNDERPVDASRCGQVNALCTPTKRLENSVDFAVDVRHDGDAVMLESTPSRPSEPNPRVDFSVAMKNADKISSNDDAGDAGSTYGPAFAPTPDIYISPIRSQPKNHQSQRKSKADGKKEAHKVEKGKETIGTKRRSETSATIWEKNFAKSYTAVENPNEVTVDELVDDDDFDILRALPASQFSNDSIKSWGPED
ncbi:hypothetical protein BD410DRAFT_784161 [Rickenella mellea]|uniref:Uncharacterized protein n=1 Tax=Rickenella mellea TaxID=50990 RepID=A0A4Y7QG85_9AGAM|nr:hypothetical protein BD410DRAFT_784161 [Rickenella mellea]